MGGCSIKKCKSRYVKGGTVKFFTLPKDDSVAKEWLDLCSPKTTLKNGRVCSTHFTSSDYLPPPLRYRLLNEEVPKRRRTLKPEAVPSLFINIDKQKTNNKKNETVPVVCSPDEDQTTESVVQTRYDQITIPLSEYKLLNKQVSEYNELKTNLEQIFTPGQMRCLTKPQKNNRKRVNWSDEDMIAASSLKNVSPKCYRYLKNFVGIPLPGFSTISRWLGSKTTDNTENTEETNAGVILQRCENKYTLVLPLGVTNVHGADPE